MKMLLTVLAMMIASPALAQTAPTGGHAGNSGRAKPAANTATTCTPEHTVMGHCELPKSGAAKATLRTKPAPKAVGKADPHAVHKKTPQK